MQSTTDSLDFVTIEGLLAYGEQFEQRSPVTNSYDHNGVCASVL